VIQQNKDLYLVDASIYVFRAWFSFPDTLVGSDGQPVNAVYGFMRFIVEFLERTAAESIAVAFDESLTTSFRNELYPAYKAHRESPPPELKAQFEACRRFVSAAGCQTYSHERFEADDLIATIAARMRPHGFRSLVVTADKDLTQLLIGNDIWWDYHRDRRFGLDEVRDRFGVAPHQMSDYLALVGDATDNIPGVPGIGPKSAVKLLRLYEDLEGIYANLSQVPQLAMRGAERIANSLRQNRDQAFLSRRLATVVDDAPIEISPATLVRRVPDWDELDALVKSIDRGTGFVERLREISRGN